MSERSRPNSTSPPGAHYRMNRAASMRLEESKKKMRVLTPDQLRRLTRQSANYAPRRPTTTSPGPSKRKPETWGERDDLYSNLKVELPDHGATERATPLEPGGPELGSAGMESEAPSPVISKKVDVSSRVSLRHVEPPTTTSLPGNDTPAGILNASDIFVSPPSESETKVPEEVVPESGWRVIDYIRAIRKTIFKTPDEPGPNAAVAVDAAVLGRAAAGRVQDDSPGNVLPQPTVLGNHAEGLAQEAESAQGTEPATPTPRFEEHTTYTVGEIQQNAPFDMNSVPHPITPTAGDSSPSTGPPSEKAALNASSSAITRKARKGIQERKLEPVEHLSRREEVRRMHRFTGTKGRESDHAKDKIFESSEVLSDQADLLDQQNRLKVVRRLEEAVRKKRDELAQTRNKIRQSLEEEMEQNQRLEKVLAAIKAMRRAGACGVFDPDEEGCRRKKAKHGEDQSS